MAKKRARSQDAPQMALALQALRQFRLIFGSVRSHFRDVEATCGVTGSQLWLLQEISQSPGIGVSDLAQRLAIHQTTCSQLVEKLVSRDFVAKTRSKDDQRRVGLNVSATAARLLKRAPGPAEGLLPDALLRLSAGDLKSLTGKLEKVARHLSAPDPRAAEQPLADL